MKTTRTISATQFLQCKLIYFKLRESPALLTEMASERLEKLQAFVQEADKEAAEQWLEFEQPDAGVVRDQPLLGSWYFTYLNGIREQVTHEMARRALDSVLRSLGV